MSTFVIADAHGDHQQILGLLRQVGIVDGDKRIDANDHLVIQLGDLCNCVGSSIDKDLWALDLVDRGVIDYFLVGNHEHPYFGGPAFNGFHYHPEIAHKLKTLESERRLRPAALVDGILITHAGFGTQWDVSTEGRGWDLAEAEWRKDPTGGLFSAIGYARGGITQFGGILWADWDEPKRGNLRQLVGHTVGSDVRKRGGAMCIDLGGGKYNRLAGAWIRDGEIEVVIHESQHGESNAVPKGHGPGI